MGGVKATALDGDEGVVRLSEAGRTKPPPGISGGCCGWPVRGAEAIVAKLKNDGVESEPVEFCKV